MYPAYACPFSFFVGGYDAPVSTPGLHRGVRWTQGLKGRKSDNMAD